MSLVYNGYMGPVIGRLGPAVGYLWRGRPVFRAYVRHIHYPNTPQQQAERQWFVAMVRFAAEARSALLQGLNEPALRQGMTEGNWFVRSNKQHFHSSPKLGKGDPQGGGVCHNSPDQITVDYPRLALSEGPVAPVTPTAVEIADDGILTVDFNKNSHLRHARAIDSVHLYLYNATLRRGLHAAPVRRCAGRVALRLPDGWQQHDLHCYLFATDPSDGTVCNFSPDTAQGDSGIPIFVLPISDGIPALLLLTFLTLAYTTFRRRLSQQA